jgi:hypothetical protein
MCTEFTDDVVTEEGTFSGTHESVLHTATGAIPPTGRSMSVDYIQVLQFRDGKHVSFNLMFDRLAMLEQLGLNPDPPRDNPPHGGDDRVDGRRWPRPPATPIVGRARADARRRTSSPRRGPSSVFQAAARPPFGPVGPYT